MTPVLLELRELSARSPGGSRCLWGVPLRRGQNGRPGKCRGMRPPTSESPAGGCAVFLPSYRDAIRIRIAATRLMTDSLAALVSRSSSRLSLILRFNCPPFTEKGGGTGDGVMQNQSGEVRPRTRPRYQRRRGRIASR